MQYNVKKDVPMVYALGHLIAQKYGENFDQTVINISNNIMADTSFCLKAKETAVMMLRCTTEQRYIAVTNFVRIALGQQPTAKDYALLEDSTHKKKVGKKCQNNSMPVFKKKALTLY